MKNHIVFKFVAVLLCAASLLGAVGSGIGIFGLTSLDLYDKTVDQVYRERVEEQGRNFANELAMEFTSKNLGGFSDEMMESVTGMATGYYRHDFSHGSFGYTLKDYEGNVLDSQSLTNPENAATYTFDIMGQYMYLVEVVRHDAPAVEEGKLYPDMPYDVLRDVIPAEGASVWEIQISSPDSSSGASGGELGTVFRNAEGAVVVRCPGFHVGEQDPLVTHIAVRDANGDLIYEANGADGVGTIVYAEDGTDALVFTSFLPCETAELPPVTEPPVEETIPVTTAPAETVPETTAAVEETAPEATGETVAQEEASEETKPKEAAAAAEAEAPKESSAAVAIAAETEEKEPAADATEAAQETQATEVTEVPTEPTVLETVPEETMVEETIPQETEPMIINGKRLEQYQINRTEYHDSQLGEWATAKYIYVPMPAMTVELQVAPGALRYEAAFTLLHSVRAVSGYLLPTLGICLLLFAVFAVYLCCAAGRSPKSDEIRAGGLNRLPLDGYFLLAGSGIAGLVAAIAVGGEFVLGQDVLIGTAYMAGMGYLACLLLVGFCFAIAAQVKMPGGFWWRNSLCGWGLKLCGWLLRKALRLCERLEEWASSKGWPKLVRLCKWLWNRVVLGLWAGVKRFFGAVIAGIDRMAQLLPLTWQWLVAGGGMVLFLFITVAERFDFGSMLAVLAAIGLILYGAHCFGTLLEATKKMNKGDLGSKVDDKRMLGAFKTFAHDLNDLADVAVVAAQNQLKSERMKTELITNVSHDIKTPLTSIINYVDLLRQAQTEAEAEEYLEVLDRQSQRLKKLIEDLMDMSKASTGNMAVEITTVDAVESVNQALGEFVDKLDKVQITPVFRHTEPSVPMQADGRLVWRVLSNLLGNAVKYAMPGTRLYIDLMQLEGQVVISLKNISRDELNVDAEELMERFVRGDDARNTEGSGLGLNIAKSLMELQKGQLQLLVDGDLFKVTLIFPGV